VYGKNAFRGHALGFRNRHFAPTPCGYHLANAVRQQVHFQQGNVFSTDFLPGTALYDVIFCRNMLIYFDDATQERALNVLARLLTSQGVLFVGPSETGLLLRHDFVSAKMPLAFAFRKVSAMPPAPKPITADPVTRLAGWGQIAPPTPALVPIRAHPVRLTAVLQPGPPTAPRPLSSRRPESYATRG
jgi:chemotaxis protein methyltransferase WspC